MAVEIYRAVADAARAAAVQAESPYVIEVRFLGGLTARQQAAFRAAADRWTRIIVGDVPSLTVDGETIDDIVISAQGIAIDGSGSVLGQAGPTALRPATAGAAAFLPAKGLMSFDTADLADMEAAGTLDDVIAHEMGHVVGVGTVWDRKGLLQGAGTTNPTFTGAGAVTEYRALGGTAAAVPVEGTGGAGTRDAHWRETVFANELMSGYISADGNPLSRVTAASLGDLGYAVDLAAAEPYALPNLLARAEAGLLVERTAPLDRGMMLPVIPVVVIDT